MMENQNTSGTSNGLPLVGIGSSQTQRKERCWTVSHPTPFQNHLVLESKPYFRIILRLENAQASAGPGELGGDAIVRNGELGDHGSSVHLVEEAVVLQL
jgi:hypothetical protein